MSRTIRLPRRSNIEDLIEVQDREVLALLGQRGWREPFHLHGCLFGFKAGEPIPVPIPDDEISAIRSHIPYLRLGQRDWVAFSRTEQIAHRIRRAKHNALTRSSIEIGSIKIPEPHRGIAVIGQSVLSNPSVEERFNVVQRLLEQFRTQGVEVMHCDAVDCEMSIT